MEEKSYRYLGAVIIIITLLLMINSSGGITAQIFGIQSTNSLKILSAENLTGSISVIIILNTVGVQAQDVFVQDIQTMGGVVTGQIYTLDSAVITTIDASKLQEIAKNPNVKQIIPNPPIVFPINDSNTQNYLDNHYDQLNVENIWNEGYTGKGIVVAVVDTGINSQLPCFQRDGRSIIIDSKQMYGEEVSWHGTFVAGCVASQDYVRKGIATGASLLNVEVFQNSEKGILATPGDIMSGWDWIAQWKLLHQNIPVICVNSLGMSPTAIQAIQLNAYASKMVNQFNISMIVASGNLGPGTVLCPGTCQDVLTVGAVDSNGLIASFSCSNSYKPDVVAPGVEINMFDDMGDPKTASGTSFSTPLTAGVAALVLEIHPNYSAQQVESVIKNSAHPVLSQAGYGNGIVDAVAAVSAVPGIFSTGSLNTYHIFIVIGIIIFFYPDIKKRKK